MNRSTSAGSPAFFLITCVAAVALSVGASLAVTLLFRGTPSAEGATAGSAEAPQLDKEMAALSERVRQLDQRVHDLSARRSVELQSAPSREIARAGNGRGPDVAAPSGRPDRPMAGANLSGAGGMGAGRLQELMALRGDGDAAQRLELARQILQEPGAMGQEVALQVMMELSPTEGLSTLRAMIQESTSGEGLQSRPGRWERALQSLSRAEGLDVDRELHSLYQMGDTDLKRAAAKMLQRRGDDTLMRECRTEIEAGLRSSEPSERLQALNELQNLGVNEAELVLPLLSDDSAEVRLRALDALPVRLEPDSPMAQRVAAMAEDPDERVRRRVARLQDMMRMRADRMQGRPQLPREDGR